MSVKKKSYYQFAILDMICMTAGFFLGILIRHGEFAIMNVYSVYRELYVILLLAIVISAILFRPYEDVFQRGNWIEFINVIKCVGVQIVSVLMYLFVVQSSSDYSRLIFVYAFLSIFIITYVTRCISKSFLCNLVEIVPYRKRLLIITTTEKAESVIENCKAELEFGYEISGLAIMDQDIVGKCVHETMVTASSDTLYDDARLTVVDSVLIDLDADHPEFKNTINLFHAMGVEINVSLSDYNLGIPNQQIVKMGNLTVLSGNTAKETLGDVMAKRALDIIGGVVGILITVLLTLIVGPLIMIESPGPIFFSQTRVGKNGRKFKIYKFRSMYMDAEERKKELMEKNKMSGLMFKMDDDPRITKVGKFIRKTSIDEFPQFLNVLKGDMSLVGTRPPTEDEFKQYKARYKKRLSMKPGITGLWQVSGRSSITDFEDVVKLDVQYIENWSFGLDLKILLQTVLVVFKHDGAQ